MGLEEIIKKSGKWIGKAFDTTTEFLFQKYTLKNLSISLALGGYFAWAVSDPLITEGTVDWVSFDPPMFFLISIPTFLSLQFRSYGMGIGKEIRTPENTDWDYSKVTKIGAFISDNSSKISIGISTLLTGLYGYLYTSRVVSKISELKDANPSFPQIEYLENVAVTVGLLPLRIFPVFWLPFGILLNVGATIFDYKRRRFSWPVASACIYSMLGNHQKAYDLMDKLYGSTGDKGALRFKAVLKMRMGDFDSALELFTSNLESQTLSKEKGMNRFAEEVSVGFVYFLIGLGRRSEYFELIFKSHDVHSVDFTKSLFEEMIATFPENSLERTYHRLLYARMKDFLPEEDSKEEWKAVYNELKEHFGEGLTLGESRNRVWVVNPPEGQQGEHIANTYVFKESESDMSLEKEVAEEFGRVLEGFEGPRDAKVVKVLSSIPEISEGRNGLVMIMEPGRTLIERVTDGTTELDDFIDVAEVYAYLHANFPEEKTYGRLDLALKLMERLRELNEMAQHPISERTIKIFVTNYSPIIESLGQIKQGVRLDGHPGNCIVEDEKIILLDCEKGHLIPVVIDLVNLTEYTDALKDSEKDIVGERYFNFYHNFKGEPPAEDPETFQLGHFNAIIERATSLSIALSLLGSETLKRYGDMMMAKGLEIIDGPRRSIQAVFPNFYDRNEKQYIRSKECLIEIREKISPQTS